jgi:hypothetical protein
MTSPSPSGSACTTVDTITRAEALPIAPASRVSAKCTSSGSALSSETCCSPCERA